MPAIFDTTVAVFLLRRSIPDEALKLVHAARTEIEAGSAILPAVAATELLEGEADPAKADRLASTLHGIPTAILPVEGARDAGSMGAYLRGQGAPIPLPDLLIAATAVWLDLPLLTWDSDYARSRQVAHGRRAGHPGADLWRRLRLHPTSRGS